MVIGPGQAKGLFKPAPGVSFPMQAAAVGKCESPCGVMGSRAARQNLRLSLFFLGRAAVCYGHRVTGLQEQLLRASQGLAAQGPVCPAGDGLRFSKWPRTLLMTRRSLGSSLSTTVEQAAGESQHFSGEHFGVLLPRKSHKPKSK